LLMPFQNDSFHYAFSQFGHYQVDKSHLILDFRLQILDFIAT
jgi:hypothetical protein